MLAAPPLSRKQAKRALRKAARKEGAARRRLAERTDQFHSVTQRFGSPANICLQFDATPYRELPLDAPCSSQAVACVGRLMQRAPCYTKKHCLQELGLLQHLMFMLRHRASPNGRVGVLDLGSGNANLAVLTHLLFRVPVFCVEKAPPPTALRADTLLAEYEKVNSEDAKQVKEREIEYLVTDVEQLNAGVLARACARHGVTRLIVLAKHLCGLGTDLAIATIERLNSSWQQPHEHEEQREQPALASRPRVEGLVAATCCWNKLVDDNGVARFCRMYCEQNSTIRIQAQTPTHSQHTVPTVKINQGSSSSMSPKGAWRFEVADVETMARCSSWRTNARSSCPTQTDVTVDDMLQTADAFESALQSARKRKLESLLGCCVERRYVPAHITPQNRVLLAGPSVCHYTQQRSTRHAAVLGVAQELLSLLQARVVALTKSGRGPLLVS